jgi:hypothetical protein
MARTEEKVSTPVVEPFSVIPSFEVLGDLRVELHSGHPRSIVEVSLADKSRKFFPGERYVINLVVNLSRDIGRVW